MKNTLSYKICVFAVFLAAFVVMLGAYTRLKDAGLGCPDWPGCYGYIGVPETSEELVNAQAAFPGQPVEAEKAWTEMVHRYFASTLGFLILIVAAIAWKNRRDEQSPVNLPLVLLALVIFQGILGMWTVTMGLLPVIVMGHLLGGMATLGLLWLLKLRLESAALPTQRHVLFPLSIIALVVIFAQISLGGWTSTNYAAIICSDFPTCQGSWLPPMDFAAAFQLWGHGVENYEGGILGNDARVTIQWMHRLGALVTTVFLIYFAIRLMKTITFRKTAIVIKTVLLVQIVLGISNVVYSLPLPVAVAHNGVAALLLLSIITACYQLWINSPGQEHVAG